MGCAVMVLYNVLLLVALVVAAPLWVVWLAGSARLRSGFAERLRPLDAGRAGGVWLHAASVGEVEAAAPLLDALTAHGIPVIATTSTATGRERLRARQPGLRVRLAPLDLPGLVHLSLRRAQVAVVVLVETEIWPNLIWAARDQGREVAIVSGRISDASFPTYRRLRFLFGPVLRRTSRIAARSSEDRDRFRALGVPVERATVGGDLKLDRAPAPPPDAALREAVGPGPFLLGGSTHTGEEEALLRAFRELRAEAPELRLILAPRHPERAPQVCAMARRSGLGVGLRSEGAANQPIVVLDTLGELGSLYALAELVFAGGTLAPVGGHNLVEPVQVGRVVVHGPHLENQRSQARLLEPLGVLHPIDGAAQLTETLHALWADPQRNLPAARAGKSLEAHRGATARALELLLELRSRKLDA
jgi:3-deoxy-D-manno-octulosonic-acid transferase